MSNRSEEIKRLDSRIEELKKSLDNEIYDLQGGIDEDRDLPEPEQDPYYEVNKIQKQINELEKERRKIRIDEENEAKNNIFDGFLTRQGSAITDTESEIDLLSRTPQAENISHLIANKETSPPLTIGIYGAWGRGKPTFINLIENQLNIINKRVMRKMTTHVPNIIKLILFVLIPLNMMIKIRFGMQFSKNCIINMMKKKVLTVEFYMRLGAWFLLLEQKKRYIF